MLVYLSVDAVRERASACNGIGRFLRCNGVVLEEDEGQCGGILGLGHGVAQQLAHLYGGHG